MSDARKEEYIVRIETDRQTGNRLREYWQINNARREFHRADGPAEQVWNPETGVLITEAYFKYGARHRLGAAALIRRNPVNGDVISESWCQNNGLHRDDDGPAMWSKDPETGVICLEEFWQFGDRHRENGPAVIYRDRKSGEITDLEYFIEGEEVPPPSSSPEPVDPSP